MNTVEVRKMLNDKDETGEYKIPFLVVCDAFQSEMTAFADLVLPDTTYLERHDVMSHARPADLRIRRARRIRCASRWCRPTGECKPFQEVLIELAGAPEAAGLHAPRRHAASYKDYPDFIVNYETEPGSGIGFLAGWRGKDGEQSLKGEPNPKQWEMYAAEQLRAPPRAAARAPVHAQLEPGLPRVGAARCGCARYARAGRRSRSTPRCCRSSASPRRASGPAASRPSTCASASRHYFDPLPFCYAPLEAQATDLDSYPADRGHAAADGDVPLVGFAERVAAPDPQPQLPVREPGDRAGGLASPTAAGCWVESPWGKVRCMARYSRGGRAGHGVDLERDRQGSRARGACRPTRTRRRKGFLLNHLITDELPGADPGSRLGRPGPITNSDPVTGQAGWYDVRVRIRPAGAHEPAETFPQFDAMAGDTPGTRTASVVRRE